MRTRGTNDQHKEMISLAAELLGQAGAGHSWQRLTLLLVWTVSDMRVIS